MRPLTARQAEVLAFVVATVDATKQAPTVAEMATHFGVSKTGVMRSLHALEDKLFIRREPGGRPRDLTILKRSEVG